MCVRKSRKLEIIGNREICSLENGSTLFFRAGVGYMKKGRFDDREYRSTNSGDDEIGHARNACRARVKQSRDL